MGDLEHAENRNRIFIELLVKKSRIEFTHDSSISPKEDEVGSN